MYVNCHKQGVNLAVALFVDFLYKLWRQRNNLLFAESPDFFTCYSRFSFLRGCQVRKQLGKGEHYHEISGKFGVLASTADEKVNKTGTDENLSRLVLELVSVPGSVPRLVLEHQQKALFRLVPNLNRAQVTLSGWLPFFLSPFLYSSTPPPPPHPFTVMVIHGLRPAWTKVVNNKWQLQNSFLTNVLCFAKLSLKLFQTFLKWSNHIKIKQSFATFPCLYFRDFDYLITLIVSEFPSTFSRSAEI